MMADISAVYYRACTTKICNFMQKAEDRNIHKNNCFGLIITILFAASFIENAK